MLERRYAAILTASEISIAAACREYVDDEAHERGHYEPLPPAMFSQHSANIVQEPRHVRI